MAAEKTTGSSSVRSSVVGSRASRARVDLPGRKGLLGRKVGMTQIFDADGTAVPVTVIEAGPCPVMLVRSAERDGYSAVQLGFLDKPRRLASRAVRGQVAKLDSKRSKRLAEAGVAAVPKADCEPKRFVGELRGVFDGAEVGQVLTVELFDGVESVDVTGTSKGRGTAGVMKRHGFKGQRASHGVKKVHRHQGGTGMNTSPARVFKGKRMAGRYGNERSTVRNLRLVRIDKEQNLLLVRGAIPGPNGSYVTVRQTNMLRRSGAGPAVVSTKKKAGAK
ncbi:MAG: 50S ribosomal protein L3 [Planctomycetia bacterium]|nr:50S ribosomal protein L3 [Planctomycetia bacterium]